jgi:hypothetical protein
MKAVGGAERGPFEGFYLFLLFAKHQTPPISKSNSTYLTPQRPVAIMAEPQTDSTIPVEPAGPALEVDDDTVGAGRSASSVLGRLEYALI